MLKTLCQCHLATEVFTWLVTRQLVQERRQLWCDASQIDRVLAQLSDASLIEAFLSRHCDILQHRRFRRGQLAQIEQPLVTAPPELEQRPARIVSRQQPTTRRAQIDPAVTRP